jgi:polysaccharide lyase-like protein
VSASSTRGRRLGRLALVAAVLAGLTALVPGASSASGSSRAFVSTSSATAPAARAMRDTTDSGLAAAAGRLVLWRANAEQPIADEWAEYSTEAHCAVTSDHVRSDPRVSRVTAPVAQGRYAFAFTVSDGDNCYGERAEVGQALPSRPGFTGPRRLFEQGDDRWIAFSVYLGRRFPVNTRRWDVIAQWKQLISTAVVPVPMLALQVHDGGFYLERAAGTASPIATTVSKRLAPAVTGRWVKITMHIVFSTDPAVGRVEIYGDPDGAGMRQLMAPHHFSTLATDAAGNAVPSHSRIGIYRSASIGGTARLYYDGYVVATGRSAAEAAAFS